MDRYHVLGGNGGMVPALRRGQSREQAVVYMLALSREKPVFVSGVAALVKLSSRLQSAPHCKPALCFTAAPSGRTLLAERQRLETILNLCAEYNKGESAGLDPLGSVRSGFPGGGLTDGSGRRPSVENILGGTTAVASASSATLRLAQRLRESDDENLKEECSSTESTHQEVRTSPAPCTASALHNGDRQHEDLSSSGSTGRLELGYLVDERVRVLSRIDELKTRLTELEQQLQESKQEAEMERALLQGERQAELDQMEAETDIITQLQHKLDELESAIQREKDKERANVEAERRPCRASRRATLSCRTSFITVPSPCENSCRNSSKGKERRWKQEPKSLRTWSFSSWRERAAWRRRERDHQSAAAPGESRVPQQRGQEEGEETLTSEKVSALENQANQLSLQASQECERLTKDRSHTLQMLQKEKERLLALEKRYHSLTGGKSFPKSSTAMREVRAPLSLSVCVCV
ncbi:hypothetical protein INR49_026737 [Caranx melampygus]|nr:hypothetical protein INR49_026737 [Caranx melampygus]